MTAPGEVVVLHPSVPVLWWLRHRPHAVDAERFLLDDLASGRTRLLVVEGLQLRVLDEIARDLAAVGLYPEIADQLFDDVTRQMRLLVDHGAAHMMDHLSLARAAFSLAVQYGIPLYDAAVVLLAEVTRLPLLITDADQHGILQGIAAERPVLRLLWLPHYHNEPRERR